MVFSAILMSMFYIGGELAQSRLGLPKSLTGVFQGLLLFSLLACDTLIVYRLRWKGAPPEPAQPVSPPGAPSIVPGLRWRAPPPHPAEPVSTPAGGGQIGTSAALPPRGLGPIGP